MNPEATRERIADLNRQIAHIDRELAPLCPFLTRATRLQSKRAELVRQRRELAELQGGNGGRR